MRVPGVMSCLLFHGQAVWTESLHASPGAIKEISNEEIYYDKFNLWNVQNYWLHLQCTNAFIATLHQNSSHLKATALGYGQPNGYLVSCRCSSRISKNRQIRHFLRTEQMWGENISRMDRAFAQAEEYLMWQQTHQYRLWLENTLPSFGDTPEWK